MTQGVKTHFFTDASTDKTIEAKYVTDGTAKAWANINQTGTQAVRDSLNVSSIVDIFTGGTEVNFVTSFSTSDFNANVTAGGTNANYHGITMEATVARTVSKIPVGSYNQGVAWADSAHLQTSVHGDLA